MQTIYTIMIVAGISTIAWGFWASYNMKKPWDTIAAFSLPAGLVVTLLGILLTCVPNFFKG